jgi:hypothetical protein
MNVARLDFRSTFGEDTIPVICRCRSVNFDKPPEWQERNGYALADTREQAMREAFRHRIKPWMHDQLAAELQSTDGVLTAEAAVARRDYGNHGYIEITVILARGELVARYLAVSRLPEGERDLYIDALIDDYLDTSAAKVVRSHVGPMQTPLEPAPASAPAEMTSPSPGAATFTGQPVTVPTRNEILERGRRQGIDLTAYDMGSQATLFVEAMRRNVITPAELEAARAAAGRMWNYSGN